MFNKTKPPPPARATTFPLERCPPEICKRIFTLACDDDGRTGRSLSLVSRYIHDVSEDIKYRSLAVWNMSQILRCHSVLASKPPHLRRIIHLFISAHEQVLPGHQGPIDGNGWTLKLHYGYACDAFFGIVRMAAPTLKTFYLCSSITRPTVFLSVPMPELVECTLFNSFPAVPAVVPHSLDFPCLKRLRFAGFTDHSKTTFEEILIRAPNVTHMFFQSHKTARELLEQIAAMFGITEIVRNRHFGKFPDTFLDKIKEIRVEAPNRETMYRAMTYNRLVQQVMSYESRVRVTTVEAEERIHSDYALIDWLRDTTREWNFPIPHRFVD